MSIPASTTRWRLCTCSPVPTPIWSASRSTAGNVPVQQVCRNNLGLLELCQSHRRAGVQGIRATGERRRCAPPKTPTGREGMGYAQLPSTDRQLTAHDAAEAWVRAAHAYPGELIGVATGPLTNLALALRSEPALPKLLRRLVIMGGAFAYRGNTTPVAEWNISVDPEAAAEVFAVWGAAWGLEPPRHLPIVLGLNLTENIAMTPAILSRLATAADSSTIPMSVLDDRGTRSTASNPLIRVLEDAMRFYFEFHFDQGEGYLAHLHDPLAAAVALDPGSGAGAARDGRRRADGHADPRHDRRRLERPLGPQPQRAGRSRRRPRGVLRPVHRPGRLIREAAGVTVSPRSPPA